MTTLELSIVCLTLFAVALVVAGVFIRRVERLGIDRNQNIAPTRVHHRVTLHTKKPDDQTLYGVLAGDYEDVLILKDASYITPQGPQPIAAQEHRIATANIAWVDVHALVAVPDSAPVEVGSR